MSSFLKIKDIRIGNKETKKLLGLLNSATSDAQDVACMKDALLQIHRWLNKGIKPIIAKNPFNDGELNSLFEMVYMSINEKVQQQENKCLSCVYCDTVSNPVTCNLGNDMGKKVFQLLFGKKNGK